MNSNNEIRQGKLVNALDELIADLNESFIGLGNELGKMGRYDLIDRMNEGYIESKDVLNQLQQASIS